MTLDFFSEVGSEESDGKFLIEGFDFDPEDIAQRVISEVLLHEDFPYEAYVSLLITDAAEIRTMNKDKRGIDSATDVLSFPMIEFERPGDYEALDDMDDIFHPDTGEAMLGDIVICHDRVISQAKEYGHSVLREYAFLIAHSMLHLLGYDHMDDSERMVMEERQRDILDSMGITREV